MKNKESFIALTLIALFAIYHPSSRVDTSTLDTVKAISEIRSDQREMYSRYIELLDRVNGLEE